MQGEAKDIDRIKVELLYILYFLGQVSEGYIGHYPRLHRSVVDLYLWNKLCSPSEKASSFFSLGASPLAFAASPLTIKLQIKKKMTSRTQGN